MRNHCPGLVKSSRMRIGRAPAGIPRAVGRGGTPRLPSRNGAASREGGRAARQSGCFFRGHATQPPSRGGTRVSGRGTRRVGAAAIVPARGPGGPGAASFRAPGGGPGRFRDRAAGTGGSRGWLGRLRKQPEYLNNTWRKGSFPPRLQPGASRGGREGRGRYPAPGKGSGEGPGARRISL
jgi:hypothetical protein